MSVTIPNLLTAGRLVIFTWFIYLVDRGEIWWAMVAFGIAWGLDAADGLLARWLHQESGFGYMFDKIADRIILFNGLLVLLVYAVVPVYVFLILTKDIIAGLGMVLIYKGGSVRDMGRMGKVMTILQGVAILWLILDWPIGWAVVLATMTTGLLVSGKYLMEVKKQE